MQAKLADNINVNIDIDVQTENKDVSPETMNELKNFLDYLNAYNSDSKEARILTEVSCDIKNEDGTDVDESLSSSVKQQLNLQ